MSNKIKIFNGVVITPNQMIEDSTLILEDGKILDIVKGDVTAEDAIEIDAGGKFISPGFIDLHVHGGGGYDFMDGTVEAFHGIAEMHARHGTTAMLPTTLTSDKASILNTLTVYEKALEIKVNGASFLGVHLEGPYLSYEQRGAQDPRYIRDPDRAEYTDILKQSSSVRRWSAAPELKGCIEFGRYLKSKGILSSIAHTDAIYEEVLEAHQSGFSLITHLYSCMSGVTRRNGYRYAGVIESAYLIDEMNVEIIADGIHLPASLLKLVYKIKGPNKIALVTDAMRAAGMPDGESILGSKNDGLRVIVKDGVAKLPDGEGFAGSVATADQLIRNMIRLAEVPLIDAVKMMTATPAAIMKVDGTKGSLTIGKDADVIIFDNNINVSTVIVNGKIEFSKSKSFTQSQSLL